MIQEDSLPFRNLTRLGIAMISIRCWFFLAAKGTRAGARNAKGHFKCLGATGDLSQMEKFSALQRRGPASPGAGVGSVSPDKVALHHKADLT